MTLQVSCFVSHRIAGENSAWFEFLANSQPGNSLVSLLGKLRAKIVLLEQRPLGFDYWDLIEISRNNLVLVVASVMFEISGGKLFPSIPGYFFGGKFGIQFSVYDVSVFRLSVKYVALFPGENWIVDPELSRGKRSLFTATFWFLMRQYSLGSESNRTDLFKYDLTA